MLCLQESVNSSEGKAGSHRRSATAPAMMYMNGQHLSDGKLAGTAKSLLYTGQEKTIISKPELLILKWVIRYVNYDYMYIGKHWQMFVWYTWYLHCDILLNTLN